MIQEARSPVGTVSGPRAFVAAHEPFAYLGGYLHLRHRPRAVRLHLPPRPHTAMKNRLITLMLALVLAACSGGAGEAADDVSAHEYAVWSAAVDAAFAETPYRRLSLDPATTVPRTDSSRMEFLRLGGVSPAMARDYAARNTVEAKVRASRLATRQVAVAGPVPDWMFDILTMTHALDGRLMVSRVGFDADRKHAVVLVVVQYAMGRTLLMERGSDGTWRKIALLEDWRA